MFPNTISECLSTDAIEFTTSSGADVPNATMVSPMTRSETLCFLASPEAPPTSQSAPLIKNTKPATIKKISKIMKKLFSC